MIYKVKHILRFINLARIGVNKATMYLGFMWLFILAISGYVYLTGGFEATDEIPQIDLAPVITKWDGKIGYIFIAILILFLTVNAAPYVIRFRNWWVHTENHKVEIRKPTLWLGLLKSRYTLH